MAIGEVALRFVGLGILGKIIAINSGIAANVKRCGSAVASHSNHGNHGRLTSSRQGIRQIRHR